jgi:hypothetical protein
MPITGIVLSELLNYMTASWERLVIMAKADTDFTIEDPTRAGHEYLESNIKFYAGMMGLIAVLSGVSGMI